MATVLPGRIPSLDGLRAVSIALVLFGHLAGTAGFPVSHAAGAVFDFGSLGVRVFFVISGFLITGLLLRELDASGRIDLRRFYLRRTLRIFPPYYAFLAAVLLAAAGGLLALHPGDVAHAVTYTSNYHPTRSWSIGHTWSLAVEEQFYLLWPALLVLLGGRRGLWLAAVFAALAPMIRLGMWEVLPALRVGMGHRFEIVGDAIATGCGLAGIDAWLRRQPHYTRFLASRMFLLVPIAVVVAGAFHGRPRVIAVLASLANVGIALCIHRAVLYPVDGVGRLLNSRPLVWVGAISYSLYLWQQLFLDRTASGWAVEFPVNVALAIVAATVSYYAIERPALRLRPQLEWWLFAQRGRRRSVRATHDDDTLVASTRRRWDLRVRRSPEETHPAET